MINAIPRDKLQHVVIRIFGLIAAAPGSLHTNSSGGALTTLYVKTSGTGNTGWLTK